LQGLKPAARDSFKSMVDWVEEYDRSESSAPMVSSQNRAPVRQPAVPASAPPVRVEPPDIQKHGDWVPQEDDGASEDAVLQALASIGDDPEEATPAPRNRMRA